MFSILTTILTQLCGYFHKMIYSFIHRPWLVKSFILTPFFIFLKIRDEGLIFGQLIKYVFQLLYRLLLLISSKWNDGITSLKMIIYSHVKYLRWNYCQKRTIISTSNWRTNILNYKVASCNIFWAFWLYFKAQIKYLNHSNC